MPRITDIQRISKMIEVGALDAKFWNRTDPWPCEWCPMVMRDVVDALIRAGNKTPIKAKKSK